MNKNQSLIPWRSLLDFKEDRLKIELLLQNSSYHLTDLKVLRIRWNSMLITPGFLNQFFSFFIHSFCLAFILSWSAQCIIVSITKWSTISKETDLFTRDCNESSFFLMNQNSNRFDSTKSFQTQKSNNAWSPSKTHFTGCMGSQRTACSANNTSNPICVGFKQLLPSSSDFPLMAIYHQHRKHYHLSTVRNAQ